MGALLAVVTAGCGNASGGARTDGGAGRPGTAGTAGGSAGSAGAGGVAGASATGAAGASATGTAGASATGSAGAGGRGAGGAAGGGGSGDRDGGTTDTGGPHDAGCATNNPDPCICGRPDANAISASECGREKSCRDAGGVWEPYVVFLPEGGTYGPRCQSRDGA